MANNMLNSDYNVNYPYSTSGAMSVVPQQPPSRPTHLLIHPQQTMNSSLFTPNNFNQMNLSTPDLINALTSQTPIEEPSSSGIQTYEELFSSQPVIPPSQPYKNINQGNSLASKRHRSESSSMYDYESSNSTAPSSPTLSQRGDIQNVPSTGSSGHDDPKDLLRREKKRERNRQAAQKCRTRKLTRIAELQKRVNELQGKNKDLTSIAENLQSDIYRLEKQLQDHHTQGCSLMNAPLL